MKFPRAAFDMCAHGTWTPSGLMIQLYLSRNTGVAPPSPTLFIMGFRDETDALGSVQVPVDAYYGAQTMRAVTNFGPVCSGTLLGSLPTFVQAIAQIKVGMESMGH